MLITAVTLTAIVVITVVMRWRNRDDFDTTVLSALGLVNDDACRCGNAGHTYEPYTHTPSVCYPSREHLT